MADTGSSTETRVYEMGAAGARIVGVSDCCQCTEPTRDYVLCVACGAVRRDGTEPSFSLSQIDQLELAVGLATQYLGEAKRRDLYAALDALRAELTREDGIPGGS